MAHPKSGDAGPPLSPSYRGRFAPSPTGPLHLGSLLTAVASYLDARHAGGEWLLRIENIDPARESIAAEQQILLALEQHGLSWDGPVTRQSERLSRYREVAGWLLERGLAYRCQCSRSALTAHRGNYPGTCRNQPPPANAICALRARVDQCNIHFCDLIQGAQQFHLISEGGDFIIWRRDDLVSYQLAVLLDDLWQGITRVIRGVDLLDSTPRQIHLAALLGQTPPEYGHLPVLVDRSGAKLSKQNLAPALDLSRTRENLHTVLALLELEPPQALRFEPVQTQLEWAMPSWSLAALQGRRCILTPEKVAD